MREEPFFSIVVPAYNKIEYIMSCFDSVASQSFSDYELLCVDDGSTDGTSALCDKIAARYEFITVVHQENLGLSAARNHGIRLARGKYIVFLDADDKLAEGALENLRNVLLEKEEPDLMVSRRLTIRGTDEIPCEYTFERLEDRNLSRVEMFRLLQEFPDFWFSAWVFTIERESILRKGLWFAEGLYHEDEEWSPRAFLCADRLAFNNAFLYMNRADIPGSIMSTPNIQKAFDLLEIEGRLDDAFPASAYPSDLVDCIRERRQKIIFIALVQCAQYDGSERYPELLKRLTGSLPLLKDSPKKKHRAAFYMSLLLGINRTVRFIHGLMKTTGKMKKGPKR